ncbi:MAG: selenocysteine-specific translation elongation factor [Firmicutes bacterium]|nr:selenocysteine-specific translation elongation factor [Bacillota bacterium]
MSTNFKGNIVGTAGHVDHGKTSLIKALTGIDTDRLKEEKKRGITIELGFAHLTAPSGEKIGIVDVPGHEKFIKNMLAGAGSIDVALLVIAADEGIMPQTREHLDILSMLKINCGVVALNKADLVEAEWLEMVAMEIEEEVKGSFLENAKIIPVSAITGEGVGELRQHIFDLLAQSPKKDVGTSFRLPIDRVFTMEGFGTVITGTLIEGHLNEGDEITIFPSMKTTKARFIQVFGEQALSASPGQRVAVNLAQIKNEDVSRGDVLAPANSMENSFLLDVRLDILENIDREILNNTRVHLYHGTRDLLCRISLIGSKGLKRGESGYAQLHLAEPLAAKYGDPFVIRFYSPLETVGGGVVLDPCPQKARNNQGSLDRLKAKDTGTLPEKIAVFVQERPFVDRVYIKERFNIPPDIRGYADFESELSKLIDDKILLAAGQSLVHRSFIERCGKRIQDLLLVYHKKNPLYKGMPISELTSQIFDQNEQIHANSIVDFCCELELINKTGGLVAHKNFKVKVNERQQKIYDEVIKAFCNGGFSPPAVDELEAAYAKEKNVFKQVLDNMITGGDLILLTPQILIHKDFYDRAKAIFADEVTKNGEITLAQFRDKLETSRKYAMALLEYFDRKKISKKIGDVRVMG